MDINPVIIFGAGSAGREALEIFNSNGIVVYGFLDDDSKLHGAEIDSVTVLGGTEDEGFTKLIGKKCDAFIAIEDGRVREKVAEYLLEIRKVMPVNGIHERAIISASAVLGHGNLVSMGAIVNSGVEIGHYNRIQAGAIVDRDVVIEDLVTIGTGARIGAGVKIEKGAFIGAGAVIIPGITIGKNSNIGAGSVVIEPIKARSTVFGNPAKAV